MSKRAERRPPATRKATEAPSRAGRIFRAIWRALWLGGAWLSTFLFPAGLAVRLTVRDDVDALAMIFYATPWVVLALCGGIAAWYWRSWRKCALVSALAAVACVGAWVWTGWRFGPKDGAPADFRVAYWNCARPGWRLRGVLPMAASWRADLLCFGESRPTGPLSPKWAEAFPEHRVQALPRETLLIGPQDAALKSSGSLNGAGEFQLVSTTLGGREVFVLIVDFDALPDRTRRPAFERLYQVVDGYATKPLIVLGDFNTPTDSVHFQRLRARMSDAFETSGRGLAATWPMPAPVLALDHILVNKHLRVVRCEHRTSIYSDHRAVVADLAWR
jgi:vancomycin resistance protein VanJ